MDKCLAKERNVDPKIDCKNGKPTKEATRRFHPDKNPDCPPHAGSQFTKLETLCANNSTSTSFPLLEADKSENKLTTLNNHDVTITTKIYPTTYKNRKGFRVGNMKIKFDTKNTPFTSTDQIDHYLNELFSYIKWASVKKNPEDETLEDRKKSIYDFLKAKKIEHVFTPKFIVDESKGGGKAKSTRKGSRKSKRKTIKKKRKVYKGGNNDAEIRKYIMEAIQNELPDQLYRILKLYPEYANKQLTSNGKVPIQFAYEITDDNSRNDIINIIEEHIDRNNNGEKKDKE